MRDESMEKNLDAWNNLLRELDSLPDGFAVSSQIAMKHARGYIERGFKPPLRACIDFDGIVMQWESFQTKIGNNGSVTTDVYKKDRKTIFETTTVTNKPLLKNLNSTTITVADLIAKLMEFPSDTAIAYTWEGQILPVNLDDIKLRNDLDRIHCPIVLMDAEQ